MGGAQVRRRAGPGWGTWTALLLAAAPAKGCRDGAGGSAVWPSGTAPTHGRRSPHAPQHTLPHRLPGLCPRGPACSGEATQASAQPETPGLSPTACWSRRCILSESEAAPRTAGREQGNGSASLNKIRLPSPPQSTPSHGGRTPGMGPAPQLCPGADVGPAGTEGGLARHSFPTGWPLGRLCNSEGINGWERHLVITLTMSQGTFLSCSCFPPPSKLSACYRADITVTGKSKH